MYFKSGLTARLRQHRIAFAIFFCLPSTFPLGVMAQQDPAETGIGDVQSMPLYATGDLSIMTLNIAHGRNQALNQMLLGRERTRQNLIDIAKLLEASGADIIALQEADGPSRWSGNFDHVQLLAKHSGYPWYVRGSHASSWLYDYGVAILSRIPFVESLHHTFQPSPPTINKGFSLGHLHWKPNDSFEKPINLDIVAVHLDYSRRSIREQQVTEMDEVLSGRGNPMIIMGDFNSEWSKNSSVIRKIASEWGLKVWMPDDSSVQTYKGGTRIDWILITEELEFLRHEVLPDAVSDHYAVTAEIAWAKEEQ
jgi:endonuclease/exonuclease/phosphatase family metal-dependent hydrolase